jgi:hypothetical protein
MNPPFRSPHPSPRHHPFVHSPIPEPAAALQDLFLHSSRAIGFSKENRPIICFQRGYGHAPLRVLVLAGQHGDERGARGTAESLLDVPPQEVGRRLPATLLSIIPEVNPDGCAAHSRCNAEGVDLNRDHQLLRSCEAVAIHEYTRRWQPHVILDLHNYPSRRVHLLARNIVLTQDVFLDAPNHPAILSRPQGAHVLSALADLLDALARRGICAARYVLVGSLGRVRHSTPDVMDARNGLALRFGAFTVLVENRQPRRDETAGQRRDLQTAQERALWVILERLDRNHPRFAHPPQAPAPGTLVPINFKYANSEHGLRLLCQGAESMRRMEFTFPRYSPGFFIRRAISLPVGYAVPSKMAALLELLRRHGFASRECPRGRIWHVEKLRIERAQASRRPDRPARKLALTQHRLDTALHGYQFLSTQQAGGDALAVFLEPESKHGLHRFPAMRMPLDLQTWYPVLRILGSSLSTPVLAGSPPLQ